MDIPNPVANALYRIPTFIFINKMDLMVIKVKLMMRLRNLFPRMRIFSDRHRIIYGEPAIFDEKYLTII